MDYDTLMRKKLLEQIYDKMSDEEKRLFVYMSIDGRNHNEIMQALQSQQQQLEELKKRQQTFGEDFASNIAGNALWGFIEYFAGRLLKLR